MQVETQEASNWWARPRGEAHANWIATYQQSLNARHRTALVQALKEIQPETLLEVGCHCGPNLVRFAQEFPALSMIGVDVNAEAIEAGQQWVASRHLTKRIALHAGRIPEAIQRLPSKSCDVVLSCYALAYIAPADLDAVLFEMGRVAIKAIVIAEPMRIDRPLETKRSLSGYSEWAHDYRAAATWIGTWRDRVMRIAPVSPPVDRLNGILVAA